MGETKHTPGPWFVSDVTHPQNACVYIVAGVAGHAGVATLYEGDEDVSQDENGIWGPHPVREANARLIAAAPEMYEALVHIGGLSRALRQGGPDPMDLQELSDALNEAVDLAGSLVAKAEGR